MRLAVPTIYRDPDACTALDEGLRMLPEVTRSKSAPLTASVLLVLSDWDHADGVLRQVAELTGCAIPRELALRTRESRRGAKPSATPRIATADDATEAWHTYSRENVLACFAVTPDAGLDNNEVAQRLSRWGSNSLEETQTRSPLAVVLAQFASVPVGLLGVSAAISVATGGLADAGVIIGVVLINATIGYFTERQAERTIAALSRSTPITGTLLRNGIHTRVAIEGVVPGDILLLTPGSQVAADARLLATRRLTVDESTLTGESLPVGKDHGPPVARDTPLADRQNMVHMGTTVTGGDGVGVVVATGGLTELGKIQHLVNRAQTPDTPLAVQLNRLSTQLGLLSAGICAAVFAIGLLRGYGAIAMLKSAVSLAVAAVPEGLPAVATTTLALGIREMRKHRVAVRQLGAVEALGSVQTVCLDKTGTLTRNHMSLVAIYVGEDMLSLDEGQLRTADSLTTDPQRPDVQRLFQIVSLCSEAEVDTDGVVTGSPTEQALVEAALAAGLDIRDLRASCTCQEMRPRAEGRPLMSTLHRFDDQHCMLAVKGGPAEVLARCTQWLCDDGRLTLDDATRDRILLANEHMAGDALRVLGVACKDDVNGNDGDAKHLTWLGLVGLADPLRGRMPELMGEFHRAGIETVMITGDQTPTAHAIGRKLRLADDRPIQILDSHALDKLDPELLTGLSRTVHVFARVSPAHKLQIVQALQRSGHVVAMTGDGINDGPALKAAEIGIALGASGTDVARQVADVVLEDDDLETLIVAVRHGRSIYANIRKTLHFLLATNFSEIEVMLAGVALGAGQPLTPMQLLWLNLLSDIFPGLALSMEPPDPDIMRRAPREPQEPVVPVRDLGRMAFESGAITAGTLAAYAFGQWRYGPGQQASSLAFNTLTSAQLLHAFVCRSQHPILLGQSDRPRNAYLDIAVGGSLVLQALTMVFPPLRRLLGTTIPAPIDLLVMLGGATLPLMVSESTKPRATRTEESS